MTERIEDLSKMLDGFSADKEFLIKTQKLIEGVKIMQGLERLVLAKFLTGELRFYAIWQDGVDKDHKQIQGIWAQMFTREHFYAGEDPLIIQYFESEFEDRITKGTQRTDIQYVTVWDRKRESC